MGFIHSRNNSFLLNAPACIVTFDTNLRITGWNPHSETVFGYQMGEALGQKLIDLIVHHTQLNEDLNHFKNATIGIAINDRTQHRPVKNGNLINVLESIFPIFDSENNIVGGTMIAFDHTKAYSRNELLICAEDVAQSGSWEFNIITKQLKATQGMFEILRTDWSKCKNLEQFIGLFSIDDKSKLDKAFDLAKAANEHEFISDYLRRRLYAPQPADVQSKL